MFPLFNNAAVLAFLMVCVTLHAQDNPNTKSAPHFLIRGGPNGPSLTSVTPSATNLGHEELVIQIDGLNSWDEQGAAVNEIIHQGLNGDFVTGIGWDLTITTVGASWLSEATIRLEGDASRPPIDIVPGFNDLGPGSQTYSMPVIDFTENGLEDLFIPNQVLKIESFENFDDVPNAIDATYVSGTLTVRFNGEAPVPTLGDYGMVAMVLTMLGLGLYQIRRRRQEC